MRFYIERCLVGADTLFIIYDHLKNIRYRVISNKNYHKSTWSIIESKILSISPIANFSVIDENNSIVSVISLKDMFFALHYAVKCGNNKISVIQTIKSSKPQNIHILNGNWKLIGDHLKREFSIIDNEENVLMIQSKGLSSTENYYYVDIRFSDDELLLLSLALCINFSASNSDKNLSYVAI